MNKNFVIIKRHDNKFLCNYDRENFVNFHFLSKNHNSSIVFSTYSELNFFLENCGLILANINIKEFF